MNTSPLDGAAIKIAARQISRIIAKALALKLSSSRLVNALTVTPDQNLKYNALL